MTVSAVVTGVALLGGLGVLPSAASRDSGSAGAAADATYVSATRDHPTAEPSPVVGRTTTTPDAADPLPGADDVSSAEVPLPAGAGSGRRVVFSESLQRVWLVSGGQRVKRTYLVSGSLYDNLDPGTYQVYSRSKQAWGIDGSTMKYFVRFTQGDSAAIGFHDIPLSGGRRVQSYDDLGTPLSHGCIRQRRTDARVLWRFAPVGTTVVVTA